MKIILEFDESDLEDKMALERYLKSTEMALVLSELSNIRKKVLRELENGSEADGFQVLDRIFELIGDEMEAQNIDVDRLIQ